MNYSELSEIYKDEIELIPEINNNNNLDSNNPMIIIEEYELLKKSLASYKNQYKSLIKNNDYFMNFLKDSQNNHFNIINIIQTISLNNNEDLTNLYINYNEKIRDKYKQWQNEYYEPRIESIKNNIEIIADKLTNYRNFFIYLANTINKNNDENKKLCSICFENEVNICLIPCGHTICDKCNKNNNFSTIINKCYTCRAKITDYIKIYFSV